MGVIKGLEALSERCEVEIYSDSKYVVNALSKGWAARWRAHGWRRNKKKRALNPDLWGKLLNLCEAHEVTIHWVKGHSGNPENERCDQLASEAAAESDLPSDDQYREALFLPPQPEASPSTAPKPEDSTDGAIHPVGRDLASAEPERRKRAIFKAAKEDLAELARTWFKP